MDMEVATPAHPQAVPWVARITTLAPQPPLVLVDATPLAYAGNASLAAVSLAGLLSAFACGHGTQRGTFKGVFASAVVSRVYARGQCAVVKPYSLYGCLMLAHHPPPAHEEPHIAPMPTRQRPNRYFPRRCVTLRAVVCRLVRGFGVPDSTTRSLYAHSGAEPPSLRTRKV